MTLPMESSTRFYRSMKPGSQHNKSQRGQALTGWRRLSLRVARRFSRMFAPKMCAAQAAFGDFLWSRLRVECAGPTRRFPVRRTRQRSDGPTRAGFLSSRSVPRGLLLDEFCALVLLRLVWLVRSSVRSGMFIGRKPPPTYLQLRRSGMEAPVGRIRHARCHAAPTELGEKGVRRAGAINMPPLPGPGARLEMCWNGSRATIRVRRTPRKTALHTLRESGRTLFWRYQSPHSAAQSLKGPCVGSPAGAAGLPPTG